jgi:DNA-binding FadR family transcriptional regulator
VTSVPARTDGRKLAELTAEQIEREIAEAGWPVGQSLGSEPELLERLGTSRAVFREAVRILENHGVARMRRGPSGGLVVSKPEVSSLARTAALHLDFEQVTGHQLFEARMSVEMMAVELTTQRIDAGGAAALREALKREEREIRAFGEGEGPEIDPHALHALITSLCGNPVLVLFSEILTELSKGHTEFPESVSDRSRAAQTRAFEETHKAHQAIVAAILDRDVETARRRTERHLAAVEPWLR